MLVDVIACTLVGFPHVYIIFLYSWACEKYARFVQLSFIYLITWTSWLLFHTKTTVKNNTTRQFVQIICDEIILWFCVVHATNYFAQISIAFLQSFFYSKTLNARHFNQCRSTPGFPIYFNLIVESVSKLRENCLHSFSFYAYKHIFHSDDDYSNWMNIELGQKRRLIKPIEQILTAIKSD